MNEEQASTLQDPGKDDASQPEGQEGFVAPDMSYAEYLKLTHPEKSDEEIGKMVRKENRYTWLGRFQILAFIAIIILVIVLIVSNNV